MTELSNVGQVEVLTNPPRIPGGIPDIGAATTEQLTAELTRAVALTAQHLQYVAEVYAELLRRGVEVSLRSGIAGHLPAIADHRLDADLVIKYAGQKMLLNTLTKLPIEEQRAIAGAGTVRLTRLVDGEPVTADVALSEMTMGEVAVAFDGDRIRPTTEQLRLLMRRTAPTTPHRRLSRRVIIEGDTLIVSDKNARIERVVEALSAHYGVDLQAIIDAHSKEAGDAQN